MAAPSNLPPSSRTSALSSQLPPPEAYESMEHQASASSNATISFGCFDSVEPALLATFLPCFTIARFTSNTRFGFSCVFVAVLILYGVGIVSFIMASRVDDPVIATGGERTELAQVIGLAWATYIVGPWSTVSLDLIIWLGWALHEGLSEEEPEDDYHAGSIGVNLLIIHFAIQLLLTIVMFALILKLRVSKSTTFCEASLWFCSCCCCPSCALGGAIESSKRAQAETVDEIPAYHA